MLHDMKKVITMLHSSEHGWRYSEMITETCSTAEESVTCDLGERHVDNWLTVKPGCHYPS